MMKSNKNGKTLHSIGTCPLVDGRQLKALCAQNLYLSPLQKNIAIVEKDLESEESDRQEMDELCLESCAKCGEIMDMI